MAYAMALVGCDPEVFVTQNNEYRSAHGLVPGTKRKPFPVTDGAVQVDGLALEFNIEPATNVEEFVSRTDSVLNTLINMVPSYKVAITPTAVFDQNHFDAQPPEAKELGCEPDYNAWYMGMNSPPHTDEPMRTASGHLHIGWTQDKEPFSEAHFEEAANVIRELDYYLGLSAFSWDSDNTRRMLYGKAGAFRPKPYGAEYRVLSNAWLKDKETMRLVYNTLQKCLNNIDKGILVQNEFGDIAKYIIDNNIVSWESDYPELSSRMKELIAC